MSTMNMCLHMSTVISVHVLRGYYSVFVKCCIHIVRMHSCTQALLALNNKLDQLKLTLP